MSSALFFETPEPESRQGRRNARGVQLLDAEGVISRQVCLLLGLCCAFRLIGSMETQLEACLAHIFAKYCTPRPQKPGRTSPAPGLLVPPPGACLTSQNLDDWAKDTNGAPFDEDSKEELMMFMDCTPEGGLT